MSVHVGADVDEVEREKGNDHEICCTATPYVLNPAAKTTPKPWEQHDMVGALMRIVGSLSGRQLGKGSKPVGTTSQ